MKLKTESFLACHVFLLSTIVSTVKCGQYFNYYTPHFQKKLPHLFAMENYYECEKNSTYCSTSLYLIPKNYTSEFWKEIEDWSSSPAHYNRTLIHRTICVPHKLLDDISKINFIENRINEELRAYDLTSKIYQLNCMKSVPSETNIKLITTVLVIYMTIVIAATIYDETLYDESDKNNNKLKKLLICFSATNYKRITITKSEDYQKLKCIQGIRTYQASAVISGHVILTLLQKYIRNPEFVEMVFANKLMKYMLVLSTFFIQPYFVISSWLATYQILYIYEKNGRFSFTDACRLVIDRLARIWPSLAVAIFIIVPFVTYFGYGPGTFEVVDMTNQACSKNWWYTFLFAANTLKSYEMCHIGLWSLSVDFQLYLCVLIFLYVVLNCKTDIKKGIAVLLILIYVASAILTYEKELGQDSCANLKTLTKLNYFYDAKISFVYFGFWLNFNSGAIGMIFGYLHFINKKNNNNMELFEKLCFTICISLPLISVFLGHINYSKLGAALVGPILKALFSFGIAAGIYGITRNVTQGYMKSLCENRYAILLGNFTFCTYLVHFFFVFKRGAASTETFEFGILKIIFFIAEDVIKSFIFGIIMTVTIEIPFARLKKLILPPILKRDLSTESTWRSDELSKTNKRK